MLVPSYAFKQIQVQFWPTTNKQKFLANPEMANGLHTVRQEQHFNKTTCNDSNLCNTTYFTSPSSSYACASNVAYAFSSTAHTYILLTMHI